MRPTTGSVIILSLLANLSSGLILHGGQHCRSMRSKSQTLRSKVIEFEMETQMSGDEKDAILYAFGLNLANQLPSDLKALLTKEELEISMKGMVDLVLERAVNPKETLDVRFHLTLLDVALHICIHLI